ncbi:MAG: ComEC family competence protein [Flavobacteriales bacterium]|nr:ComEC family competence protein [Flavobacteriales bacterium]
MRLLQAFPAIRLLVPFMVGVIGAAFALEQGTPTIYGLVIAFGLWCVFSLILLIWPFKAAKGTFFGGLAVLSMVAGGALLLFSVSGQVYPGHLTGQKSDTAGTYLVTVDGEVHDKPRSYRMEADAISADGQYFGRVLLYVQRDSLAARIGHGDRLLIHGQLARVRPAGNPNEFNYARYLRFHHIHHQAYLPQGTWQTVRTGSGSPIRFFIELRQHMLDVFHRAGLDGAEHAVAAALVLGYKADLEQSLVQAYAGAGATHVLAVSGLHVGIIYLVINWLLTVLTKLPNGERVRAILTVVILIAYAMLTGLSPSVTRAVAMFSFVALAKSFGRTGSIYNTLACSAIGLVIYDPLIVMQVGFQLSYAAVLGIVLLQPWLVQQFSFKHRAMDWVWGITCVSVAAQLATFPLGLLYFHQFPNLFFVSNLFVIPAATGVLVLGIVTMAAQVWDPLLAFIGLLLNGLIGALNGLVSYVDRIPYAVASGIDITVAETLIVYLLIACAAWLFISKEARMMIPVMALGIGLFFTQTFEYGRHRQQRSLTVYNIRKETAIAVTEGTRLEFMASPDLLGNEQSLLFHVRHHWWAQGVDREIHVPMPDSLMNRPFCWNGSNITIVARPMKGEVIVLPDSLDVAIIHSVNWKDVHELARQMPPLVILSSSLGQRTRATLREAIPDNVEVWDVESRGAFMLQGD